MIFRLGILFCVVLCVTSLPPRLRDENETIPLSVYLTIEYIESQGYVAEKHDVTTEDGYILGVHRIPYGRYKTEAEGDRPVVLLMHGLYSASIAFVALGHEYSVAFNFADAGFDVWMGNARGSKLSRRHVTMDPDEDPMKFFDFSWEEIGMYDVAAMVDYILEYTGKEKLHYIGHSQGGTVFLVLASMRPEYNEKISSAHLLAGVGYMDYFPNEELASVAAMTDFIYSMAVGMGLVEIFPPNSTEVEGTTYTALDYCLGDLVMRDVCRAIGIKDVLPKLDLESLLSNNDGAGGGSLKQIAHYGQNIRDKEFRRYHYGSSVNQEIYNSPEPPAYDLGLITIDTVMHYTISDILLDERDVLAMVQDMPNAVARKVARDSFLHEDFSAAPDAKELVTKFMVQSISAVEGYEYTDIFEESEEDTDVDTDTDDNTDDVDEQITDEGNEGDEQDQGQSENDNEQGEDQDNNEQESNDGENNDDENDVVIPPTEAAVVDSSSNKLVLCSVFQLYVIGYALYLLN